MISPQDDDYKQTKLIKRTGAQLGSPFRELADWVGANYGVHVLNVIYDTIPPDDRPRVNVVLETEEDAMMFRRGPIGNFNKIDQKRVEEQWVSILSQQCDRRFNVEGMFVFFSCFERVAREEANDNVTDEEIRRLKERLANDALWEIDRCFDSVTFFFYTDAQVTQFKAAGLFDDYAQEYSRIVQVHDEFAYLQKRGVAVHFDSKENFDTKYHSNWMLYYR